MNILAPFVDREVRHFHFFCGSGFGAKGFNRGEARVGKMRARFRCIGGVDVNAAAIRDFDRQAGVKGTVLDLFTREQYVAFHGKEPPPGWRAAGIEDIRRAAGGERPHIIFLSAPCKGNSGLLAESMSKTAKYVALNELALRGVFLMCEAWADDPPELIIFENVPRIAQRSRHLLDQIIALLRHYGYAVAETTHDCGELGGLAQTRKRYLLVARHAAKIQPFLYEPPKQRLRGVGEVLERLPLPGDPVVGPMHRMPSLQWKTWVRLAFVEAGSDWRSLNRLRVADGVLQDFAIAPETQWHRGALGVRGWGDFSGTISANGRPASGPFNVADPRIDGHPKSIQMGVSRFGQTAPVVNTKMLAGGGRHAVADPRISGLRYNSTFRIVRMGGAAPAIHGPGGPGGLAVADPRPPARDDYKSTKYRVTRYEGEAAGAVIGASTTGNGAFALADPRPHQDPGKQQGNWRVEGWGEEARAVTGNRKSGASAVADPRVADRRNGALGVQSWPQSSGTIAGESLPPNGAFSVADPRWKETRTSYVSQPYYGVLPWEGTSHAIQAASQHDNGRWSVADPRIDEISALPAAEQRIVAVIRAPDDTWHRPFTTYELAALQSCFEPEEQFELDGLSDSAWRERIGNAVPPAAAKAVADEMGRTLLLAWSGETFVLSATPIWVRPVVIGLMAAQGDLQELA